MIDQTDTGLVDKYFDVVQQKIKDLISEDPEIKRKDIDKFNSEIFNQPLEIQDEIRRYISDASDENLNIEKIARVLYDKFKTQVKNNVFAVNDKQDIPNQLVGERKHIKTFEKFNDNKI